MWPIDFAATRSYNSLCRVEEQCLTCVNIAPREFQFLMGTTIEALKLVKFEFWPRYAWVTAPDLTLAETKSVPRWTTGGYLLAPRRVRSAPNWVYWSAADKKRLVDGTLLAGKQPFRRYPIVTCTVRLIRAGPTAPIQVGLAFPRLVLCGRRSRDALELLSVAG